MELLFDLINAPWTFKEFGHCGGIDFTGSNISQQQILSIDNGSNRFVPRYEKYSFQDACRIMGVTEKQFEFLVLSNVVEVRDRRFKKVTVGFDSDLHHVPKWALAEWLHSTGKTNL